MDISAEDAAKRGNWGDERYEKRELQDRVRQLFADIRATADGADFITVDAGKALGEVEAEIQQHVNACITSVDDGNAPLRSVQPW